MNWAAERRNVFRPSEPLYYLYKSKGVSVMSIIRNLDSAGRLIVPLEFRKKLDLSEKTPVQIDVYGESIVLTKFRPRCSVCEQEKSPDEMHKVDLDSPDKRTYYICDACKNKILEP